MAEGVFYFGYFLLDKQKKVTCRRATPTSSYSYGIVILHNPDAILLQEFFEFFL
jgi:hypothetical protein